MVLVDRGGGGVYDTSVMRLVLDTNVLVSALMSRRGASFELLSRVGQGGFELALSVALVLEYEDVLLRFGKRLALSPREVRDLLDYLCSVGVHQEIFYLWRPRLRDPKDEMVLELAVAFRADAIVTFNGRDFRGAGDLGIRLWTPGQTLTRIGVRP